MQLIMKTNWITSFLICCTHKNKTSPGIEWNSTACHVDYANVSLFGCVMSTGAVRKWLRITLV